MWTVLIYQLEALKSVIKFVNYYGINKLVSIIWIQKPLQKWCWFEIILQYIDRHWSHVRRFSCEGQQKMVDEILHKKSNTITVIYSSYPTSAFVSCKM